MESNGAYGLMQALSQPRFVRFYAIGGLTFLIDVCCAWMLLKFLPKVAALALSYMSCCLFHYVCSKHWTFRDTTRVSARQLWAYAWSNLITLVTNTALSAWLLELFGQNVFFAKAVALLPTSVVGFLLLRWFVFPSRDEKRV